LRNRVLPPMKRLLLVLDPIAGSTSVQFEILGSLVEGLGSLYDLSVYTPFCDPQRASVLAGLGCRLITPDASSFHFNRFLDAIGDGNESMLWAESWTREALLHGNSRDVSTYLGSHRFEYVVNLSMTVPVPSDLWWILGTPLDQTIRGMASSNLVAKGVDFLAGRALSSLDAKVIHRIQSEALHIVVNSPYLSDLYRARGVPVQGVVYTLKDLSDFQPTTDSPRRDYVLLYIGKETDHLDFGALLRAGVRIVGFGSKIPTGTHLKRFTHSIEWLGQVSKRKLVDLYANALFTLFPFTCEPMGLVPIESMACGTPVLTYGRQGPGTTVVNDTTGWLVNTSEEMMAKAVEVWRRGETGIRRDACVRRAQKFSAHRMVDELVNWVERGSSTDSAATRVRDGSWGLASVAPMAMGRA